MMHRKEPDPVSEGSPKERWSKGKMKKKKKNKRSPQMSFIGSQRHLFDKIVQMIKNRM